MSARKGLQRYSFATYIIHGSVQSVLIRRNGARCYYVSPKGKLFVAGFFCMKCTRLRDAVELAREMGEWPVKKE